MKRIALACLLVAAPLASPASAQDVILELLVPAGVNYDLFVTGAGFSCEPFNCSSTAPGSGATESIVVYANDTASDDSFTAAIEVRYGRRLVPELDAERPPARMPQLSSCSRCA